MSNLEEKLRSNKKIEKKELLTFINDIIINYNLYEYITNIVFSNSGSSFGNYDFNTNILEINYDLISKIYTNNKTFNMELMLTVFHELTYVFEKKEVFDNTFAEYPDYYVYLITEYYALINKNKEYLNNRKKLVIEYTATICSYINTIELYKKNNIDYTYLETLLYKYVKNYKQYDSANFDFNIKNLDIKENILFKYNYALQHCKENNDFLKKGYKVYQYKK